MPGPSSVLLPHGVRKACRRLRETGGADPWCGPGLTTSVVLLSILEYYAYSISPGQAAAHGGHAMLSGGHVVLLNIHVPYDSHNEPSAIRCHVTCAHKAPSKPERFLCL